MSEVAALPDYLREEILLHPENREFPRFDLVRLLGTVFKPTEGCRVCIPDEGVRGSGPADQGLRFSNQGWLSRTEKGPRSVPSGPEERCPGSPRHERRRDVRLQVHARLEPRSGRRRLGYRRQPPVAGSGHLPKLRPYPLHLHFLATAPLTALAKQYGFRGATLHGLNDSHPDSPASPWTTTKLAVTPKNSASP